MAEQETIVGTVTTIEMDERAPYIAVKVAEPREWVDTKPARFYVRPQDEVLMMVEKGQRYTFTVEQGPLRTNRRTRQNYSGAKKWHYLWNNITIVDDADRPPTEDAKREWQDRQPGTPPADNEPDTDTRIARSVALREAVALSGHAALVLMDADMRGEAVDVVDPESVLKTAELFEAWLVRKNPT